MDQSNVNRVKNNTDLVTKVTLDTKSCSTITPTREQFLTQKKIEPAKGKLAQNINR
jgi:ethanolamine utilization cobalamin adenosyltransferase